MAEEKKEDPPPIGCISLILGFVVYTVGYSLYSGHLVSPMEGKGGGFLVILFLYAVFKLLIISWIAIRNRLQRRKS
jgi:hypothetical protein